MNLHQNRQIFADAVRAAAQRYKIQEIFIEKDYWVTVALSQCHKLIERFSEDIDIVILRKEGELRLF